MEYTHLVGALGFAETVRRLSGHKLVAVDEFELDDPGDTMLMTRLLGQLCDAGVHLTATSNTLPDKLGEGRFAAEDFRREIHALAARFQTLRVDGPDYRHPGWRPRRRRWPRRTWRRRGHRPGPAWTRSPRSRPSWRRCIPRATGSWWTG